MLRIFTTPNVMQNYISDLITYRFLSELFFPIKIRQRINKIRIAAIAPSKTTSTLNP